METRHTPLDCSCPRKQSSTCLPKVFEEEDTYPVHTHQFLKVIHIKSCAESLLESVACCLVLLQYRLLAGFLQHSRSEEEVRKFARNMSRVKLSKETGVKREIVSDQESSKNSCLVSSLLKFSGFQPISAPLCMSAKTLPIAGLVQHQAILQVLGCLPSYKEFNQHAEIYQNSTWLYMSFSDHNSKTAYRSQTGGTCQVRVDLLHDHKRLVLRPVPITGVLRALFKVGSENGLMTLEYVHLYIYILYICIYIYTVYIIVKYYRV